MPLNVFGTPDDVRPFFSANAVGFKRPKAIVFKQGDWSPGAYINNRTLPSHPTAWDDVMKPVVKYALHLIHEFDAVASVATGGVPHGVALARELGLPHFVVKKQEKGEHGLGGLIDGDVSLLPGMRLLLVEDMSSTFVSSIRAMRPLEHVGATIAHTLLLNTWGFPKFYENIGEYSVHALCTGQMLLDYAAHHRLLDYEHEAIVRRWLKHPEDRSWADDGTWELPKQASR